MATTDQTVLSYQANPLLQAAVERWFEIIGEAIRRIDRHDPGVAAAIPDARTIIDFRNRLAHGYDTIDHVLVWRYIRDELPTLRAQLVDLIAADGG